MVAPKVIEQSICGKSALCPVLVPDKLARDKTDRDRRRGQHVSKLRNSISKSGKQEPCRQYHLTGNVVLIHHAGKSSSAKYPISGCST